VLCRANAHRTLAELLWASGRCEEAAHAVRRALALDDAKANAVAAAATRERFAALPAWAFISAAPGRAPCAPRR
jgi:hypothetical protein